MKIIKLLSQLRIKVRDIDRCFLLTATLLIKYLKEKTCIVTFKLYPTLSVEQNSLLILEEEKHH